MRGLRAWLASPIADRDRQRAFVAAAVTLLLAGVALTLIADPPDHPPPAKVDPQTPTRGQEVSRRQAASVPADVLDVARRFLDGYLAHLYGHRRALAIPGASAGLRRRLSTRPIRVPPAMRRQYPRVERIDGQRLPGGWLVEAHVATRSVSFPIAVLVSNRRGVLAVTRLVED